MYFIRLKNSYLNWHFTFTHIESIVEANEASNFDSTRYYKQDFDILLKDTHQPKVYPKDGDTKYFKQNNNWKEDEEDLRWKFIGANDSQFLPFAGDEDCLGKLVLKIMANRWSPSYSIHNWGNLWACDRLLQQRWKAASLGNCEEGQDRGVPGHSNQCSPQKAEWTEIQ